MVTVTGPVCFRLKVLRFFHWKFVGILRWQGLKSLRENSRIWEVRRAHHRSLGSPGFPVEGCGFGCLHVVLFRENHISGRQ